GHLGHEHGPWLPVAERQLLDVVLGLGADDVGNQQRQGEEPGDGSAHEVLSHRWKLRVVRSGSWPSASAKPAGPSSVWRWVGRHPSGRSRGGRAAPRRVWQRFATNWVIPSRAGGWPQPIFVRSVTFRPDGPSALTLIGGDQGRTLAR